MKKSIFATILMLVLLTTTAFADVNVVLDGKAVEFNDDLGHPFKYEDSRVMVPFRILFELFEFNVNYDNDTETILATNKNDDFMILQINNNLYFKNEEKFEFDTAPLLIENRTYVPVRIISEMMHYKVDWSEETQTATITR